jgi:hypothetical protein
MREFVRLCLQTTINPVRGYHQIKYEKRGKLWHVLVLFILMCLSFTVRAQYVGFALVQKHPLSNDVAFDFAMVTTAYLLFCVGNWSITCLMDGKGKFIEILKCTAYAFTPMILLFIPLTIVSHFLITTEAGFYYMAIGVSIFWFIVMLFIALLIIHEFSFSKMLATVVLTLLAILMIVFVVGLVTSMLSNMFSFFRSIYTELIYRL